MDGFNRGPQDFWCFAVATNKEGHNTHGWLISALLREMPGLEGQAMFECVESKFSFNRCLRRRSVEAPRLWQKMATQLLVNVEGNWVRKRMGVFKKILMDKEHIRCTFMWADNFWIMTHSKSHLEQMLRDLIQEAEKWDLAPSRQACDGQVLMAPKRRLIFQFIPRQDVTDFLLLY